MSHAYSRKIETECRTVFAAKYKRHNTERIGKKVRYTEL